MSAVRFIAWGMIDLEEKTHRERLELFAQVKKEIRKAPYRLTLRKAGLYHWPTEQYVRIPATAYKYSLSKYIHNHKKTRRRSFQIAEGPLKGCCEVALREMEIITQRGNQG